LTPEDIERREFLVALRGYDKDEVHRFLAEVAAEYREAVAHPPSVENETAAFGRLAEDVADIVRTTAEHSHALRRRVEDESAAMRAAAEQDAATTRANAERDAAELVASIEQEVAGLRAAANEEASAVRAAAHEEAAGIRSRAHGDAERLETDALARAQEHVRRVVEEARERFGKAAAAEQEAVDYLRGVAEFASAALDHLGGPRLLAAIEHAIEVVEAPVEHGGEMQSPSAAL
jgi:DivIVA domain-containing protein